MNTQAVILVIGAGAIGGIVAGILTRKGYDVTLVTKHPEIAKKISQDGMEITGTCGNFHLTVPSVSTVTQITKRPDIVLIATKALDMPDAARAFKPLLCDTTQVVSLQNGIVEEELASIVGAEKTVGCVVGWGATMHEQTKFEMTSTGEFVIGYPDRKQDENLTQLAEVLNNIVPVEITDSILPNLYSKLIINSCITTLGAISGMRLGKMLSKKHYRAVFLNIITEAIDVAKGMDCKVPSYAGKLDYYELLSWNKTRQHLFLRAFGLKYRRLTSSSLQSLQRGKKTEVRYFNGYIVEKGMTYGIETPVNQLMLKLVEEIEEGKRQISEHNLRN